MLVWVVLAEPRSGVRADEQWILRLWQRAEAWDVFVSDQPAGWEKADHLWATAEHEERLHL